jgi:glutamate 5-kinase
MGKSGKPRVLIKIGTATLTKGKDKISRAKLEDLAIQIVELKKSWDVVLVCSGAIAAAKQFIQLEKLGSKLQEKQALASIGQPFLMRLMHDSFRDYGIPVGQCLLSYSDFNSDTSKKNIINTISVLLDNNILPIINENDTTATEEIKFGDNDKLSALAAVLLKVDLLILATNTYGIYDDQKKTIAVIDDIDDVRKYISTSFSSQGTGGMQTKLEAAALAQKQGIESWVVNGHEDDFLLNALNKSVPFSLIRPLRA